MTGGERYAETAALVAHMEGDHARLKEILDDMLPGELRELAETLDGLRQSVLDTRLAKLRGQQSAPRTEGTDQP